MVLTSTSALSGDRFGPESGNQSRPERLISFGEVRNRIGLSRTSIWRLERAGDFPRSVQISPGRRAWREADISAWIDAKLSSPQRGE